MDIIQAVVLGIVQGLTEFIPVSSSGHLVLVPWALGWPSPGLFFDTMLHWGTLAAVLVYFWRDWIDICRGFFRSLFTRGPWNSAAGGRLADANSRVAWALIVGTIPAVVIGFLFKDFVESLFDTAFAVGAFMLVTAAILALSERLGRRERALHNINLPDSIAVGFAQAAALAPGLSRSGATISAGLARGLTRDSAARFSFLLGTPAILGAGVLQLFDIVRGTETVMPSVVPVVFGTLAAGIAGYLCIRFLLAYLRRGTLYPFAIYCAVVGLIVILASLL